MKNFTKKILLSLFTLTMISTNVNVATIVSSANSHNFEVIALENDFITFPDLETYFKNEGDLELVSAQNTYLKFTSVTSDNWRYKFIDDYTITEISEAEFNNNSNNLLTPYNDPNYTGHVNNGNKLRLSLQVFRNVNNRSEFTVKVNFLWKGRPIFAFTDAIGISGSSSLYTVSDTTQSQYAVHSAIKDNWGNVINYVTDVYNNPVVVDKDGILAEVDIRKYGDFDYGHEGYLITKLKFQSPSTYQEGAIYGEYVHTKLTMDFSLEDGKIKPGAPSFIYSRQLTDVNVHNGFNALPAPRLIK